MNNLTLVKSEHFGEIEADIYSNGDDMFMTINQLADCLEYADKKGVEKLIDRNPYLKKEEFSFIQKVPLIMGGTQNTRTFTEDGIYEVTMLSGQPKAKEFRTWIRGVLKALRRGEVKMEIKTDESKQARAEAMLKNSRARAASLWLKLADRVEIPEYKQICNSYAAGELAGREVLPLPQSEQHYYSATEVGALLGGMDKARVGKLANAHGLKTDEFGKWFHDKSPYSVKEVDAFKYNEHAVQRFREILGLDEVGA